MTSPGQYFQKTELLSHPSAVDLAGARHKWIVDA